MAGVTVGAGTRAVTGIGFQDNYRVSEVERCLKSGSGHAFANKPPVVPALRSRCVRVRRSRDDSVFGKHETGAAEKPTERSIVPRLVRSSASVRIGSNAGDG
jgi:hypothetical protein